MRMWIMLGIAICMEVTATLSLKAALTEPGWYAGVLVGYVSAFALLYRALKEGMPLGIAYGVWGASGVALTAVLSMWIFADPFSALMGLGVAIIILGVLTVEIGSQRAHQSATKSSSDASQRTQTTEPHATTNPLNVVAP